MEGSSRKRVRIKDAGQKALLDDAEVEGGCKKRVRIKDAGQKMLQDDAEVEEGSRKRVRIKDAWQKELQDEAAEEAGSRKRVRLKTVQDQAECPKVELSGLKLTVGALGVDDRCRILHDQAERSRLEIVVQAVYRGCRILANNPSDTVHSASLQACQKEYSLTVGNLSWCQNEKFLFSAIVETTKNVLLNNVLPTLTPLKKEFLLYKTSTGWNSFKQALDIIYEPLKCMQVVTRSPPLLSLKDRGVLLWKEMIESGTLRGKIMGGILDLLREEREKLLLILRQEREEREKPLRLLLEERDDSLYVQPKDYIPINIQMLDYVWPDTRDLESLVGESSVADVYLEHAACDYARYSKDYVAQNSGVGSYLEKVEICFDNDLVRAPELLPDFETVDKLSIIINREMIHNHLEYILEGLAQMLTLGDLHTYRGDLKRMCRLLKDNPFWLRRMCEAISSHLLEISKNTLAEDRKRDPGRGFMQLLINLDEKLRSLEEETFLGESRIQESVASTRRSFMSDNLNGI